ncbi:MAG: hypothetical protein R3F33_04370 [Planctomycetota bacterium]
MTPTSRPSVPRVNEPSALSRARQRAQEEANNRRGGIVPSQGDRTRTGLVPSDNSRTRNERPNQGVDTGKSGNLGSGRLQAARTTRRPSAATESKVPGNTSGTGSTGLRPSDPTGSQRPSAGPVKPDGSKPDGIRPGGSSGAGRPDSGRPSGGRPSADTAKANRDRYLSATGSRRPSAGTGITPGSGTTTARNRGDFRPSSNPGVNLGTGTGDITGGSHNHRSLYPGYGNNHCWQGGSPWSHYYWNWNYWGTGYGWWWCPTAWVTSYWWDSYWYYGGYWRVGYVPSFYYYGPFTQPHDQIVIQVVQESPEPEVIVVQQGEAVQQPAPEAEPMAPVGMAPAPAPASSGLSRAADYYLTLGDRSFRDGRYSDAVHHYGKAVEYAPGEGVLFMILSDALFATGDYHYGAYALRRALEIDPALAEMPGNKRSWYGVPSDLDLHLTRARTWVLQHPEDDDARLMLAANEIFVERPEAAIELLGGGALHPIGETTAGHLLMERARQELANRQKQAGAPEFVVEPLK